MNEFISSIDMTDATDLKSLTNAMELDREMIPLYLLYNLSVQGIKGYRPKPNDFKEVPDFYKQMIAPGKFGSTSILVLGETREFMKLYAKLNVAVLPKEEKEKLSQRQKLELMVNAISNDTLKSLFLNDQMEQMVINNLSEFKENIEPFKKYTRAAPAKNTYESIYNLFSGDTAFIGKSSYNFLLPDTSGKMVSMKDFKGKVVFVDVWATWCGPCKAQFPFMKAIEEEYHDNPNVVFASISIDRAKDQDKWINMIRKESLGGVQLLDDTGKTFAKQYKITAVPRFLLIDKNGKWIEIRCPLPEAKDDLKKYLEKALAE